VHETGVRLGADFIVAGSIGKVGESVFADVFLFDVAKETVIWNNQYKEKGTIDEFVQSSVQAIADGIKANLPVSVKQAPMQESSEIITYEQTPKTSKIHPPDNGIAKGIAFGVKGLFALGSVEVSQYLDRAQSPAGFMVYSVFPLSPKTHLRVRAGIPLWHVNGTTKSADSDEYYHEVTVDKQNPDPYFSIEHAWGWERFGFSLGLSYLFLNKFTRDIKEYDDFEMDTNYYHFEYDNNNFFDVVCSIRGGKTRAGFYGMIAFPLAITLNKGRTDFLLEYSVFGVFGAKNTKVGIGHMGMIKAREADDSLIINGSQFYYDNYPSRESYLVFPCLKIAQLIAEHVVLNLSLELGGTIIPRFGSEMDSWRPSIGVDILYSFGKLSGPNLMDGTF